jgi:hypothetical protein
MSVDRLCGCGWSLCVLEKEKGKKGKKVRKMVRKEKDEIIQKKSINVNLSKK